MILFFSSSCRVVITTIFKSPTFAAPMQSQGRMRVIYNIAVPRFRLLPRAPPLFATVRKGYVSPTRTLARFMSVAPVG